MFNLHKDPCPEVHVKHCSLCNGDIEYYCHVCQLDLCYQCMENHSYTYDHYVTNYKGKFADCSEKEKCKLHSDEELNSYCDTCHIPICIKCGECEKHINHKTEEILTALKVLSGTRRVIFMNLSLNSKRIREKSNAAIGISHEIAYIRSKMLLKAKRIKNVLDEIVYHTDISKDTYWCFSHEVIQKVQKFDYRFEQLASKPVQFLRFIKKNCPHQILDTINLIKYLSEIEIKKHNKQCTDNRIIFPALVNEFQLQGQMNLDHVTLVTPRSAWVKGKTNFVLIDMRSKEILEKFSDTTVTGQYTVNNKQELLYINKNYEITRNSNDSNSIIEIERAGEQWLPQCVYCSPSTGDLFVGMWISDKDIGKIAKYDNIGKLTLSIQYDIEGRTIYSQPSYVRENKNGDVIVSDFEHGVVVTDCEGIYRFSYTGSKLKPRIQPGGICVDVLSNILVCDWNTRTVHVIDKNGAFLDYILTEKSPGIHDNPISLDMDYHTNHLWVVSFEKVSVYTYFYNYNKPLTAKAERSLSIQSPYLNDLFESICTTINTITDTCPSANDVCDNLVKEMASLSREVCLYGNVDKDTKNLPLGAFIWMEIEVEHYNNGLIVRDKTSMWDQPVFFTDSSPKLILVTSKCLSVAEAKLAVYRYYKDIIDEDNVFIYHSFDEVDDISRLVAVQRLSSFCNIIEPYIQKMNDNQTKNIKKMLEECKSLCQPTEQRELVKEWEKREIYKATGELKRYPSILKYILGRKNDRPCVKVFLREKDENAAIFFKKQSNVFSMDTMYEFVNIKEISKKMWQEMEEIKRIERATGEISPITKNIIEKIVETEEEKMYAKHSNLVGIGISNVLVQHESVIRTPCIVLYCLDKTLVPFGENPLPRYIKGYPCDIREDLVVFGSCDHCSTLNPGCNIGSKISSKSGSAGFLVEQQNRYKGFLTAAHVVFDNVESIYRDNAGDFSNTKLNGDILHPSNSMRKVGELHSCIFGNFISCGSDIAIVHTSRYSSPSEQVHLQVVDDDNLRFDSSVKVIKRGNVTHDTTGILWDKYFSIDIGFDKETRPSYTFKDIYRIVDENETPFFEIGDSGSGVFVLSDDERTLKPLGIAFAKSEFYPITFVCKIKHIMDDFQLAVCYNEPMDTS